MTDADPKPTPSTPTPTTEMRISMLELSEALTYWMNKSQRAPTSPIKVKAGLIDMPVEHGLKVLRFTYEKEAPEPFQFRQGSKPA